MDISKIKTFLAIVKYKNISRAADSLFISQATASQRLNSLEETLGQSLIERGKGNRLIELTPAGEKFLIIAHKWVDLYDDVRVELHTAKKLHLSIGYTESMNIHLFAPFYKSLINNEEGPEFDILLRTERSSEIYKMIESKELDVGFVYSLHPNSNILIKPFFYETLYVITFCEDYGDTKTELNPSVLEKGHEIYTNWSTDFQLWHRNYIDPSYPPYMVLDSEYTIIDYLDSGKLWAIVPWSVAILSKKHHPKLKIYPLAESPPSRICYKILNIKPRESRAESMETFSERMNKFIIENTGLSPYEY